MLNAKKITPMFNKILLTAEKYKDIEYVSGTGIIDASKEKTGLKEYQTVLAVGRDVTTVKVGDLVCINPVNYVQRKYDKNSMKSDMTEHYNAVVSYNFPMVTLDKEDYLFLVERDIDFIVDEYEEIEDVPAGAPQVQLVGTETPKLIL